MTKEPGTYNTVRLPGDLMRRVDAYLDQNTWGYRSRAEVISEALRLFLREANASPEAWRRLKQPTDESDDSKP